MNQAFFVRSITRDGKTVGHGVYRNRHPVPALIQAFYAVNEFSGTDKTLNQAWDLCHSLNRNAAQP